MSYEFVAIMLRDAAGTQGMKFFPLVFSLFMFVLVGQPARPVPLFLHRHQPHHRHLRAGAAGDRHRGRLRLHEARFRLPEAVRAAAACRRVLVPLVVLIEVISFLSRPISLSVRLFANMLAGHITLKVFAGFVTSLQRLGAVGVAGAVLPLAMTVAHHRARIPGRVPAGLRLRGADLHVSQRRHASRPLRQGRRESGRGAPDRTAAPADVD